MTGFQGRGDPFTVAGRLFQVPALGLGLDGAGERLAVAFFAGGRARLHNDVVRYSLEPGAVDLGLVRSGRAPLLLEHAFCLECLLGSVVSAELDGGLLKALARFATGGRRDEVWSLLDQGFPLSLSLGATIDHAVRVAGLPDGGSEYRVERWRLRELSVVPFGRDEDAHLRLLGRDESADQMVGRMRAAAGEEARAAVRRALHLDRWEAWPPLAAAKIAARFGLDAGDLAVALDGEVREHCARLERELAL